MKIEEALKVLYTLKMHPLHKGNTYHKDAVSLGIEALKRIMEVRESPTGYWDYRLPGETKEQEGE